MSTAKAKLRMTLAVWNTGRLAPSVVNLMRWVVPSVAARPRMPPTMRLMPAMRAPLSGVLLAGLREWMEQHDYDSLEQMRGSMNLRRCPNPHAFERANYVHVLQSWNFERT